MENVDEGFALTCHGKPSMAHNFVLRMVDGLLHTRHIVVVDNFFWHRIVQRTLIQWYLHYRHNEIQTSEIAFTVSKYKIIEEPFVGAYIVENA